MASAVAGGGGGGMKSRNGGGSPELAVREAFPEQHWQSEG